MTKRSMLIGGLLLAVTLSAWADLQNVQVGGRLRIRWRGWTNVYTDNNNGETRIPNNFLPFRATGDPLGVSSMYSWSHSYPDPDFVEMSTTLHVSADFTQHVAGYIEFESFDIFGEDFRSDYVTGADTRANTSDDIEVVQSYVEASQLYGTPLRLRVGRQVLNFGKGWLVGQYSPGSRERPFDAVRLSYLTDSLDVDVWYSKLTESGVAETDGDVDFYGIYATYKAFKPLQASAYWMLVRDARSINDTNLNAPLEWLEDVFHLDNYDPTLLNTVGTRLFGEDAGFDYDLEVAYQFGNADGIGSLFRPIGFPYGDDNARFNQWGGDLELGYTLDVPWAPRVFVGGAYYGGEDNRTPSLAKWLIPLGHSQSSVSFNRLFSNDSYTEILDRNRSMSNFWQIRAGTTFHPTDKIEVNAQIGYFSAVEPFDPPASIRLGSFRVPLAPTLSFWTDDGSSSLGYISALAIKYQYSQELFFRAGWQHFFTGEGLQDGVFVDQNGLRSLMGTATDDADYLEFEAQLNF